jgi:transglutaminase superfamily protein
MLMLVLRAYMELIRVDVRVSRQGFAAVYRKVQSTDIERKTACPISSAQLCRAMDLACVWYWKQVLCLQRSAATTCLLRCHGVAAEMVIGTQQIPFAAHAWVEVDGAVVTDKPYMREMYAVIDTW